MKVQASKNQQKIEKKSKLEAKIRQKSQKFDFGGQKLAKKTILEAKKAILEAKMEPRGRFWRQKWSVIIYDRSF